MREGFRGVVVKEWVAMPNERTDFSQCNKALVEKDPFFIVNVGIKGVRCCMTQNFKKNI